MRRRTLREIQHRACSIDGEGFGLASVAREGAVELRALAEQLRQLRKWKRYAEAHSPKIRTFPTGAGRPRPKETP